MRTNTSAKKFGALRTIKRPKQGDDSYHIWIEGTRARADLLYNDGDDIWHQQIFAGLTLKASPGKWNGDKSVEVKFKVTDAGEAVDERDGQGQVGRQQEVLQDRRATACAS